MRRRPAARGFVLLPVVLALGVTASIAYRSNRDSGSHVAMVSGSADAEKARYAAEAGLEHANHRVQQSDCVAVAYPFVINPVASGNFGGASYTAHVSALSANKVELTSTGSYNGASATLVRKNVTVYRAAVQSQTIQPGPGDPQGRDTYLSKQSDNQNFGASPRLQVRGHSNHVSEALIRFGIGLPEHARIVDTYSGGNLVPGAQLSVHQAANASSSSGGSAKIEVTPFLVQTPWTSGATWNTSNGSTRWPAGERDNRIAVAPAVDSDAGGGKTWNITEAAQAWVGNRRPNHGLWLVPSGGNKELEYVSSEETGALDMAKRPKLILNFLAPCA